MALSFLNSFTTILRTTQEANDQKFSTIVQSKTEGTTQTWGQLIVSPGSDTKGEIAPFLTSVPPVPPIAVRSAPSAEQQRTVPLPPVEMVPIAPRPLPTPVSPVQRPNPIFVDIFQDTKDIQRAISRFGTIEDMPCKVKSDIAVAAHSKGLNPSVVVPRDRFRQEGNRSETSVSNLAGSVVNNVANVAQNVIERVVVLPSKAKSSDQLVKVLSEARKIDLSISLRTKESNSIQYNTIKVPEMNVQFNYNFFVESERDVRSEEDRTRDPLLKRKAQNVPRYVDLRWGIAQVTEPVSNVGAPLTAEQQREINKLKRETFCLPKGVAGFLSSLFKNSFEDNKKRIAPITKEGVKLELMDVQNIDQAFGATANDAQFPDTICTVINTKDSVNEISELPIEEGRGRFRDRFERIKSLRESIRNFGDRLISERDSDIDPGDIETEEDRRALIAEERRRINTSGTPAEKRRLTEVLRAETQLAEELKQVRKDRERTGRQRKTPQGSARQFQDAIEGRSIGLRQGSELQEERELGEDEES